MTWSVLVVDDNQLIREVLCDLIADHDDLSFAGSAGCGTDALRIAGDVPVDAVICDIRMPVMTGLELIPLLLEIRPELVVVTYSSEAIDPTTAHRLGIAHTFDKADDIAEILDLVVDLCTRRDHRPTSQENTT